MSMEPGVAGARRKSRRLPQELHGVGPGGWTLQKGKRRSPRPLSCSRPFADIGGDALGLKLGKALTVLQDAIEVPVTGQHLLRCSVNRLVWQFLRRHRW